MSNDGKSDRRRRGRGRHREPAKTVADLAAPGARVLVVGALGSAAVMGLSIGAAAATATAGAAGTAPASRPAATDASLTADVVRQTGTTGNQQFAQLVPQSYINNTGVAANNTVNPGGYIPGGYGITVTGAGTSVRVDSGGNAQVTMQGGIGPDGNPLPSTTVTLPPNGSAYLGSSVNLNVPSNASSVQLQPGAYRIGAPPPDGTPDTRPTIYVDPPPSTPQDGGTTSGTRSLDDGQPASQDQTGLSANERVAEAFDTMAQGQSQDQNASALSTGNSWTSSTDPTTPTSTTQAQESQAQATQAQATQAQATQAQATQAQESQAQATSQVVSTGSYTGAAPQSQANVAGVMTASLGTSGISLGGGANSAVYSV